MVSVTGDHKTNLGVSKGVSPSDTAFKIEPSLTVSCYTSVGRYSWKACSFPKRSVEVDLGGGGIVSREEGEETVVRVY